jgi:SAM-dependent methyltransferase
MKRSFTPENIDNPAVPDDLMGLVYADLAWIHRSLGNTRALMSTLRNGRLPTRRILDIGCGHGQILAELRQKLGVEVVGIDLRKPAISVSGIPIIQADAARDPLPRCDTAIAVCVAHHLLDHELVALIRNVGRSCDRFIILDLVRHLLPLVLFRLFVAPLLHPVNAADGASSIRRSYEPEELGSLVRSALDGSDATFRHDVNRCFIRQIVDISYRP